MKHNYLTAVFYCLTLFGYYVKDKSCTVYIITLYAIAICFNTCPNFSDEGTLYRFDSEGNNKLSYRGHSGDQVNRAAFTNSNKHMITAGDDGSLHLFDIESGDCLYGFFNHRSEDFKSVAVNKTGSMVLAPNTNGMLYILVP